MNHMRIPSIAANASRWAILLLAMIGLASAPLSAATVTWTGSGGNTLWSNTANWGGVLPATNDIVVFPSAPATLGAYTVTYDIAGGLALAQIDIVNDPTTPYTITSSGGPSPLVPLAINVSNVSGTQSATISAPLGVTVATTMAIAVALNSGLNLSGVISGAGNVLFSGPAPSTMNGTLANTLTGNVTVQAGTLTLAKTGGATSIAGPLIINSSTAMVMVVTAAGAANAISNTSTVTVASGATFDITNAAGTDVTPDNETVGSLVGAGTVVLGTRTLGATSSATPTTYSGVMSGTGGFRKSGTNTQRFTGANSYTGTTTVAGAAMVILGTQPSSAVSLKAGTLSLAGASSVGAISTVGSTGTNALAIGNQPSSTNVATSLGLNLSGATSRFDAFTGAAAANSKLFVNGTVNLTGATLQVDTNAFTATSGSVWLLIDNDLTDAVVGTFAGLAEGATVTAINNATHKFSITYVGGTGNDVMLIEGVGATTGATTGAATGTGTTSGTATGTSTGTTTATASSSSSSKKCGLGGGGLAVLALALAFAVRSRRRA